MAIAWSSVTVTAGAVTACGGGGAPCAARTAGAAAKHRPQRNCHRIVPGCIDSYSLPVVLKPDENSQRRRRPVIRECETGYAQHARWSGDVIVVLGFWLPRRSAARGPGGWIGRASSE